MTNQRLLLIIDTMFLGCCVYGAIASVGVLRLFYILVGITILAFLVRETARELTDDEEVNHDKGKV